jgi:ABC-type transport system substrate-binding protein
VAAACTSGGTTTTTGDGTGTTTATTAGTTTTAAPAGFTYRLGIFQDTTTDNFWAYIGPAGTVWNQYVLSPTKPSLFGLNYPGIELDNDVAASADVPTGAAEGDGWAIEVAMRDDATWSDGTAITANDIVFTYETVRDLALGGSWLNSYPIAAEGSLGLTAVEAVDDNTVKFVFNERPGLAIWPHQVGLAPIMPAHIWGDAVEEAKASEEPAEALYAVAGTGLDVSGGPMIFAERAEGTFARNEANTEYYDSGATVESGGVTYTIGPFATEAIFSLYGGQDAAVLALAANEVDYLLNPLGMQRGLLAQVEGNEELTAVVNPTNGFRYMAFNLRKEPMSIPQFRQALALMIDKEFMANNVLQGAAFPLYVTVPEGNTKWYNEEVAESVASNYVGKTMQERLEGAVALLTEGGFTWTTPPAMAVDADGAILQAVVPGEGLLLNGNPIPELEVIAPGPGYDPFRATYSVWIETWLNQLGFDAEANPTDFNALVDRVYGIQEDGTLAFDMYLLGWSLGNPALPTYHESFFASKNDTLVNEGDNAPGFANAEFDALVEQFNAALTEEEAYDIMWQMEEILAAELPYILLFDTGILEFYRQANVNFPFTQTLSGLQFLSGQQGTVTGAR